MIDRFNRLIPVPRGMSHGFYAFMGAGVDRSDSGEIMMLNPLYQECEHSKKEESTEGNQVQGIRRIDK